MQTSLENRTVGEIVAEDYRTAEVFQRYGIDFCCGGDKAVSTACAEKDVDVETVASELAEIGNSNGPVENYTEWAPDFLADYIVNQHHTYAKRVIPQITQFANKVARVHGDRHPETREIAEVWHELSGEMVRHMQREELMLFPYIKQLVQAGEASDEVPSPVFGSVPELLEELEGDHEHTGDGLAKMEELSNGYTPPQDACNTYRALYASLQEFDARTKEHVHLENNLLFPRTITMEDQGKDLYDNQSISGESER